MAKRPELLNPLRVRIRRLQLIVGTGFIAYVLGAILTAQLSARLQPGLTRGSLATAIFGALLTQVWAYAVLPPLLYGVTRIIEVRPWSSAVGGVATGTVFQLSVILISGGFEAVSNQSPARWITMLLSAAVGAWTSALAIRSARAASMRAEDQALEAAEARKIEYDEFAREAERTAARTETGEQAPQSRIS